ncbi:thioesterase II family protein [Streptomyces rubiginosohelvolus]|uniref:thioesterase II family protein n=1 Tax=Streptomyces rubiginosohelvolus TaxID=67362 RepID=UPI0035DBCB26
MSFSLVCLPFAGGGAGFYRAWPKDRTAEVRVVALQLPGREERFGDAPFTDVRVAARRLVEDLRRRVPADGPFALFGHSLGAVLAYEMARELEEQGAAGLCHLFVSGSPGPWTSRDERATGLDDDSFVEQVSRFAGYRHSALDQPALRDVLLPTLRADVEMHENYKPSSSEPLSVPITTLRGADDGLVPREQCAQWSAATRGGFTSLELPGGHMYVADDASRVLDTVAEVLRPGSGR